MSQRTKIRAAVLNSAPAPLDLESVYIDAPLSREVRVNVRAVGLCHSDLHYVDAVFATECPEVLGHEISGVVESVGPEVTDFKAGDHVVACLTMFCGTCKYCTNGQLTLCTNRSSLRSRPQPAVVNEAGAEVGIMGGLGAFAEKILVHENALVRIDDAMPFDTACLLGCGVMTGIGAVFNAARVRPGSTVAVFGCGGIGNAAIQGARIAGASKIIAVDVSSSKLETALELGATHTVNGMTANAVEEIHAMTGGGVDYSFEAIGKKITAEQAFESIAPGGTATIMGMIPDSEPIVIKGSNFFSHEKKLQGTFLGSNQFRTDIPVFIEYYFQGKLLLDEMISNRISLDEINEGFAEMRRGEGARSVILMGSEE